MLDAIQDWIGGVALLAVGLVATWARSISSRLGHHSTQLAVHEAKIDDIPKGLVDIKTEIMGLRQDGRDREKALYQHMDKMRLEIKSDLSQKVDKV